MLFDSEPTTLYEGVWEIERVDPLSEDQILVSFKTAFYETKKEAEDPTTLRPYDRGPNGNSIQTVALPSNIVPSIEDFNRGNRSKIHGVLTEELDFETVTRD